MQERKGPPAHAERNARLTGVSFGLSQASGVAARRWGNAHDERGGSPSPSLTATHAGATHQRIALRATIQPASPAKQAARHVPKKDLTLCPAEHTAPARSPARLFACFGL